ncbi:MAG: hypothetical protein JSW33_05045 [bacterium]|nr:MAG: hypothetical protein JSW33_05045 [bacterium]
MNRFSVFFLVVLGLFLLQNITDVYAQDAQEDQGPAIVVTTIEVTMPEDGSMAEFDSLNQLYTDNVIKKNDLIVNFRTLRHWWGHNNREMLVVYEVKTWGDVIAANQKNNELFEKAWTTKESRKAFNDAYNKYFTGKHSDEIYSDVKSGRK